MSDNLDGSSFTGSYLHVNHTFWQTEIEHTQKDKTIGR